MENSRYKQLLESPESPIKRPSNTFLSRPKHPVRNGGATADVRETYEEMRRMLCELSARGVDMPARHRQYETCGMHLRLMLQHIGRAIRISLCPSSWRSRKSITNMSVPHRSSSSSTLDNGTEVELNEDRLPNADVLALWWLIMPVGTWKEKYAI